MTNSPRICVQIQSMFIETQSQSEKGRYVFTYTITLRNLRRRPVQLMGRYWLITNANGQEIKVLRGGGRKTEHPSRRRVSIYQRCGVGNSAQYHAKPL